MTSCMQLSAGFDYRHHDEGSVASSRSSAGHLHDGGACLVSGLFRGLERSASLLLLSGLLPLQGSRKLECFGQRLRYGSLGSHLTSTTSRIASCWRLLRWLGIMLCQVPGSRAGDWLTICMAAAQSPTSDLHVACRCWQTTQSCTRALSWRGCAQRRRLQPCGKTCRYTSLGSCQQHVDMRSGPGHLHAVSDPAAPRREHALAFATGHISGANDAEFAQAALHDLRKWHPHVGLLQQHSAAAPVGVYRALLRQQQRVRAMSDCTGSERGVTAALPGRSGRQRPPALACQPAAVCCLGRSQACCRPACTILKVPSAAKRLHRALQLTDSCAARILFCQSAAAF